MSISNPSANPIFCSSVELRPPQNLKKPKLTKKKKKYKKKLQTFNINKSTVVFPDLVARISFTVENG